MASPRPHNGLPELAHSFHHKTIQVTVCGGVCLHRKEMNPSVFFAGQAAGLKEEEF